MRLVCTAKARTELREIVLWRDNPPTAKRMRAVIETTANYLKQQPLMGRIGAIDGTREAIPHPSYRIVYQVDETVVSILSVVHTSRQWPPVDDEGD